MIGLPQYAHFASRNSARHLELVLVSARFRAAQAASAQAFEQ
jgi:hypothetical protein